MNEEDYYVNERNAPVFFRQRIHLQDEQVCVKLWRLLVSRVYHYYITQLNIISLWHDSFVCCVVFCFLMMTFRFLDKSTSTRDETCSLKLHIASLVDFFFVCLTFLLLSEYAGFKIQPLKKEKTIPLSSLHWKQEERKEGVRLLLNRVLHNGGVFQNWSICLCSLIGGGADNRRKSQKRTWPKTWKTRLLCLTWRRSYYPRMVKHFGAQLVQNVYKSQVVKICCISSLISCFNFLPCLCSESEERQWEYASERRNYGWPR